MSAVLGPKKFTCPLLSNGMAGCLALGALAPLHAEESPIAHPCRTDARYRAFDFWVGAWDVRPANAAPDAPPAENIVTLEHDGCVVQEHWRGRRDNTGSSFNIYDASRKMWFQTWVDSTGELHEYRGNPDEHGNMRAGSRSRLAWPRAPT